MINSFKCISIKYILLVFILFCYSAISAQESYFKGSIVTEKGSRLEGYIAYRKQNKTPSFFNFKDSNNVVTKFDVKNCRFVEIYNLASFEANYVNISLNSTNESGARDFKDLHSKDEDVFLEVLQVGKVITLYKYVDFIKNRFYIKEHGASNLTELKKFVYINSQGNRMIIENVYIQQLEKINLKHNLNVVSEGSFNYSQGEITEYVSKINGIEFKRSEVKTSVYYAGAGMVLNRMSFDKKYETANGKFATNNTIGFGLNIGNDLFFNPQKRDMLVRLDLGVFLNKNMLEVVGNGANPYAFRSEFRETSFSLGAQFVYSWVNAGYFKPYAGLGLGALYAIYGKRQHTATSIVNFVKENDIYLSNKNAIQLTFPISFGIVINNKIDLTSTYYFKNSINGTYSVPVVIQRIKVGINYRFD